MKALAHLAHRARGEARQADELAGRLLRRHRLLADERDAPVVDARDLALFDRMVDAADVGLVPATIDDQRVVAVGVDDGAHHLGPKHDVGVGEEKAARHRRLGVEQRRQDVVAAELVVVEGARAGDVDLLLHVAAHDVDLVDAGGAIGVDLPLRGSSAR